MAERADPRRDSVGIDMHQQLEAEPFHRLVAEGDHLAELPRRIDMEQREWRPRRIERLHRQVQHDGAVLADRIEHHRIVAFGDDLAHDVNAFRFQAVKVGQGRHAWPLAEQ